MTQARLFELIPAIAALETPKKHRAYPRYAKTESTWLGELPAHWKARRLKYVANSRPSNVDKKTVDGEPPVRLCNYVDVYKNDYITPDLDFMHATADPSELAKFRLRRGDVLITKDSEEWNDIAVPAFVTQDFEDVACGYHLSQVRPHVDVMDGEYLFRAFRAGGISEQFQVAANGVTRFGIAAGAIGDVMFPVPPLDEQRAIAAFLNRETVRIDRLIADKRRLIELLAEHRVAIITHIVTKGVNQHAATKPSGIEWLGNIPKHWLSKKVKHLATILRGKFTHRPRNEPRMYDGPHPFIQTGDIAAANKYVREFHQTLSEEGLSVSKQFPKGTLVMSIAANIGDMAILDFEACFPDSIVGFVPKRNVLLHFLFYLFTGMRSAFFSTATLNTQLNLNIERIGSLWAVLPPPDEQQQIVDYLDAECRRIDDIVCAIESAAERIREYRSALITAAVTGRIDVRQHQVRGEH